MHYIGIDLGGTKIEGVVLDDNRNTIFKSRLPTQQQHGYAFILNTIKKLYKSMLDKCDVDSHTIGIGTPGSISQTNGLMRNSNTLCLNGQNLSRDLEVILDHDIVIENDANCFVLAEALHAKTQKNELVFGIILGTGCGGGFVLNNRILGGVSSLGGEWGHMSLDPNGPECYCGNSGCVETYISGSGAERRFEGLHKKNLPMQQIIDRYRNKDDNAQVFMKSYFRYFGQALANVVNAFDPHKIILGGGLSNIDELYREGFDEFNKRVFGRNYLGKFSKNELGDSSGVLGAALLGSSQRCEGKGGVILN